MFFPQNHIWKLPSHTTVSSFACWSCWSLVDLLKSTSATVKREGYSSCQSKQTKRSFQMEKIKLLRVKIYYRYFYICKCVIFDHQVQHSLFLTQSDCLVSFRWRSFRLLYLCYGGVRKSSALFKVEQTEHLEYTDYTEVTNKTFRLNTRGPS